MNKYCTTHGKRHLLLPDSHPSSTGMCAHPKCLKGIIVAMLKRYKFLQGVFSPIWNHDLFDPYISYLVIRMLKDAERGFGTVAHKMVLYYSALEFMTHEMSKGEIAVGSLPPKLRSNRTYVEWTNKNATLIAAESSKYFSGVLSPTSNIEQAILVHELLRYMDVAHGRRWPLFICGALSQVDIARMENIKVGSVNKRKNRVLDSVRGFASGGSHGKEDK